ncbi:MAG TPA: TonB-dependent receptor [Rhizomicrobium sp.]|nr:TonB-dependent receptor [Rhizomicrobium sp.]
MRKRQSGGLQEASPVLLSVLLASTALTAIQTAQAAEAIETVVVTAEKRSEDLQKVPLSIQVFNTEKLEQLHVTSFNDYAQFLPSVAFAANAAGGGLNDPGFANVYMRGVASGNDGNHSGSQPSVGMYLDEQPITTIGGSLDIHVYDIARVEALAGPQGTLYGASSEAGTIRIITNKPDPSDFSASYEVSGNAVEHGDFGGSIQGYVNLPLSSDSAIRIVAWDEHDAGYIDNVAGTDLAGGIVNGVRTFPIGNIQVSNAAVRKNNYNDADIYGARAALKIDLDNYWSITPSLMGQETNAHGSFAFNPAVGDLEVVKFNPEFSNDTWYQAALTIEGKLGNLDVTFAGAYMQRRIKSQLDYSDYSYFYDTYYDSYASPPGYLGQFITDDNGNIINPTQIIHGRDTFTKQSAELRVASPAEDRLRYVAGLFFERQTHAILQRYVIDGFSSALSVPGWPDTIWLTDQDRDDKDYAAFTEISYDITPDLTATAGGRIFESVNSLVGFFGYSSAWDNLVGFSNGEPNCFAPPIVAGTPCTDLNKETNEDGFTHKLNLTWRINDDRMVYATWSTGFRPGGVNRNSLVTSDPYKPDYLTNYEVGWKTSWMDGTLRWNGAAYWENWKDFQFSFLGPNSLTVIANAGQARILGAETDVNWRVNDNLTLTAAASYNDARLTSPYCKDPNDCAHTLQAPDGQQLPITPPLKANATARYTFRWMNMDAHVQGALVYQDSSWADLRTIDRQILGKQQSFVSMDFSAGLEQDNWAVELALLNAFDEREQLYRYSECTAQTCGAIPYIVTNRPRTIELRLSQKF